MAGNPYTESGEKFQIPDMLANRADIYNLGEIIGDSAEAFELSYLENSLTSNPVLSKLASTFAERTSTRSSNLPTNSAKPRGRNSWASKASTSKAITTSTELNEFTAAMVKLMRVRDVVLTVNREYIRSAAQHDDYRTEPPFLLQGSYRNMNRIAEKVLPVMNDAELETLIGSSYQNDAQTLTTGTEANLLKFKELLGILTDDERSRWEEICRTFRQNVKLRGIGSDDKVGQVIATIGSLSDGLDSIRKAVTSGTTALANGDSTPRTPELIQSATDSLTTQLQSLNDRLEAALSGIDQLADRPIQVDVPPLSVPPIEMKWPENLPFASLAPASAPDETPESATTEPTSKKSAAADRITVVNRLPKTVYNVLEKQFNLMQGWLKPLAEMAIEQQGEIKELRPMVEECLTHYQTLLKKLEEAHDRESAR